MSRSTTATCSSTVEPEDCSGVAKEVDPPFIFDLDPAATDGGHWMVDDVGRQVYIEEMVGVYRADYDPKDALAQAKRTIAVLPGRSVHGHRHAGPLVRLHAAAPGDIRFTQHRAVVLQRQGLGL